jgi:hypothetical protein
MDGEIDGRAEPLRPGDPRQLGRYELVGRLGEGGMSAVYGRPVGAWRRSR